MIVDTSAILSIVYAEAGHEELARLLVDSPGSGMAAPNAVEAGIVLAARLGSKSHGLMERLLAELRIELVPFEDVHVAIAVEAYRRFGKGRHSAALNFGDCIAYATARAANVPLLYVGDDFSKTDIESAVTR